MRGVDRVEGRKIFVTGRLLDGDNGAVRCRGAVREAATRASRDRRDPGGRRPSGAGRAGATGCANGPSVEFGYRIAVAVIGLAVLGLGILAIPYPGPGLGDRVRRAGHSGHRIRLGAAAADLRQGALRQGDGLVQAPRTVGADRSAACSPRRSWWRRCGCSARSAGPAELVGIEQPWLKSPIGLGDMTDSHR